MMRGRLFCVGLCACGGSPPPITTPVWPVEATVDSGSWEVSIPVDNAAFDDPRRAVDTGLAVSGNSHLETPELYLRHGVVAWSLLDVQRAHVKITAGDFTCAEMFDVGSALAEGIHVDLDPVYSDADGPRWQDVYLVQNARPAMANGIVQYAGEGTPMPEEALLQVHSWGDRVVEVSFTSTLVSSGLVALTNCGERAPWRQ